MYKYHVEVVLRLTLYSPMSIPPHHQRVRLGFGPAPGKPWPAIQCAPNFQSYPGVNSQYHGAGLGTNLPQYQQPYGVTPQHWGYGYPTGGYGPTGCVPPANGFALACGLPNDVPRPEVIRPKNVEDDERTVMMGNRTKRVAPSGTLQSKTYPNKQIMDGGMWYPAKQTLPLTPLRSLAV
jgi:hypothetical protein